MDQKTKLMQEAVASRDSLREELVEVYVRVRLLPKEELPLRKEGPKIPASFAVLESLVAFAKQKAEKGGKEAQSILENIELEEELPSATLQDVPASGVSAANMDVEEEDRLELGVPAPGASLSRSEPDSCSWRGGRRRSYGYSSLLSKNASASEDASKMEKISWRLQRWSALTASRKWRHAANFGAMQTNTEKRLDNPGLHMRWKS
eukprot:6475304-Amphidinium_carterae.1